MTGSIDSTLVGRPGSRRLLSSPALVLDLDRLEDNIRAMAEMARLQGVALRPHAKTHKSAEIARRQIAAGAAGQCCAKLAEAEALADHGIAGLLLTSPVVTERGIARLMALLHRAPDTMVVADNPDNVAALADAAAAVGLRLGVLVDLDVGLNRTGVTSVADGLDLARRVAAAPSLHFRGVQAYAGHAMHVAGRVERRRVLADALSLTGDLCTELTAAGLAPAIVTGGGTGSFDLDPSFRVLTELQVGSYIFMDREYADIWTQKGEPVPFQSALFVQTSVISANIPGQCTTDAGCKAFATEAGPPVIIDGAPDGARYAFFGDEQGRVTFARPGDHLPVGAVLTCMPPHCDPTVNLYDHMHVVRGDMLVDIWPVTGRGRSQ
ncbi:DSD1 family PLP-dependent enzyme [Niveispirillum sp.]|uniref:DSD1 family PLP-dependent enzyme n=1 Tax=Niveispirillum sp. TaxID=1917217 RepID=UPI001B7C0223|nr:DSD1 family PLP-dependent enzyme [Niveispirillum sp.]MBP7335194.1 DSD1 family PLP-dependent enzyme [Niveispirillum sp.]